MKSKNIFISLLIIQLICIGMPSPVPDKILIDLDNNAYVFTTTTPPSIPESDNAGSFKGICPPGKILFNGKCAEGMNADLMVIRKELMSLSLFFQSGKDDVIFQITMHHGLKFIFY